MKVSGFCGGAIGAPCEGYMARAKEGTRSDQRAVTVGSLNSIRLFLVV